MKVLQLVSSMPKLKSPRRTEGEMAHSWVRKSDKSERNKEFGLGEVINDCTD